MTAHSSAVQVRIAFGAAPDAASPTWTDVTQYVRIDDGISYTLGDTSEARMGSTPGSLELTLDNLDNRYDPTNTSGPHYGDLTTYCPIELKYDGTAVWRGAIDSGWSVQFQGVDSVVRVTAVDALGYLANVDVPTNRYQGVVDALGPSKTMLPGSLVGSIEDVTAGLLHDDSHGSWSHGTSPIVGDDAPSAQAGSYTSHIRLTDASSPGTWPLDDTSACTYEAWVVMAGSTSDEVNAPQVYWAGGRIYLDLRNHLVGVFFNSRTSFYRACTYDPPEGANLRAGIFHVVVAFDAPSGGVVSPPTVYLNGRDCGSPQGNSEASGSAYDAPYGVVGEYVTQMDTDGQALGPVHVYDSALTATNVADLYEAGSEGATDAETVSDRIERLAEAAGWTLDSITPAQGIELSSSYEPSGSTADALALLADSDRGRLTVTSAGELSYWQGGWWWDTPDLSVTFDEDLSDANTCPMLQGGDGAVVTQSTARFYNHTIIGIEGGGRPAEAEDATSIANVGRRTYSQTGLYLSSAAVAQVRADFELALRKYEGALAELVTWDATKGGATDSTLRGNMLSNAGNVVKCTVTKARAGGGSNMTTTAFLSGVSGTIDGTVHHVNWYLEGQLAQITSGDWGDDWGTAKWGL